MDNYTRVVLTVIAVLLTLIAVPLWTESADMTSPANAAVRQGIPDAGQQLNDLIVQVEATNATLDEIVRILKNETIKVEVIDKKERPLPASQLSSGKITFIEK